MSLIKIPAGFDWLNPTAAYTEIWLQRERKLIELESDPEKLVAARMWYRDHVADFIQDWGVTVNPKNATRGRPIIMPFLLYPKQREFVDWVIARWRRHENGVLVKSRECGASWMAMAISVTLSLFWDNLTIGFGSAKEEFVDKSGDPTCLFYKGRTFLKYLPAIFKPGYDPKKHSAQMRLLYPNTESAIVGGAGDNIGVGGRTSMFFVDEYAVIERPKLIETNLSANTDTRLEMSTVRGVNNVFAEHARGGLIPRFDFSYRDDPTKVNQGEPYDIELNAEDAEKIRAGKRLKVTTTEDGRHIAHVGIGDFTHEFAKHVYDMDEVIFNQEYGCDFLASIEGGVIEAVHIHAAIGAGEKLGITPSGEWVATYDVADLGTDKNAVAIRHGVELHHVEQWSGNNSNPMQSIRRAFSICDKYGCKRLVYDASGMGGSWHEYFAMVNEERKANGQKPILVQKFQGGGAVEDPDARAPGSDRTNKDYYENLKAQSWMCTRMRFVEVYKGLNGEKFNPDEVIIINPKIVAIGLLETELAQPTRTWSKNGKLMIDKTPDGMASPNMADAVMMAFGYSRPALNFGPEIMAVI
jgi:hypothetical protein